MSSLGSVTDWLARLPQGDREAVRQLWQRLLRAPLCDLLEFAIRGGDEGQSVAQANRGAHRGPEAEVEAIDDPLVQLLGRLRRHFEVIRAVRFAHERGK